MKTDRIAKMSSPRYTKTIVCALTGISHCAIITGKLVYSSIHTAARSRKGAMEMKKIFEEFKKFISRGNVIDLAVGVIIGGAFTAIVNSLVNDIFMPFISLFTGGLKFDTLKYPLNAADNGATVNYGSFISAVINFLLIAVVVFILVKTINKIRDLGEKSKEKPEPKEKPCPFCKKDVAHEAIRCPYCTSLLEMDSDGTKDAKDAEKE